MGEATRSLPGIVGRINAGCGPYSEQASKSEDDPGADDGIRTRDPHLGKVVLYQLSHVRAEQSLTGGPIPSQLPVEPNPPSPLEVAGSSATSVGCTFVKGTTRS
jgi:hypothetical protein